MAKELFDGVGEPRRARRPAERNGKIFIGAYVSLALVAWLDKVRMGEHRTRSQQMEHLLSAAQAAAQGQGKEGRGDGV